MALASRLEDRAEIAEQMFRYARATDWLEPERHREVFIDDCVFASPHSGDMHGVDAVVTWMDRVLAQFEATQHMIGNHIVALDGDAATMRSYVQATHVIAADPKKSLTLWATYHDALVRTPDGWRIRDHRLESHGTRMFTSS